LNILKRHITEEIESGNKVVPMDEHFSYALYALFSFICFGEKFDERTVRNIQRVHHGFLHNFIKFNMLNVAPFLSKIVFRGLWREILKIHEDQVNVFLPIIKARQEKIKGELVVEEFKAYVDALFYMKLSSNGSKLRDEELVSMCAEFMIGGTDTTVMTWLWCMANLVKYQHVQENVFDEIKNVVEGDEEIEEEHLKRMPYLKVVVLETLRRHPIGYFILLRQKNIVYGFDS